MVLPVAVIRASALLDVELEHRKSRMSAGTFLTGIKAVDQDVSPGLWTGGKLIGMVPATGTSVRSSFPCQLHPLTRNQLVEEIISEHLLSFHERVVRDRELGNGFIIAPHSSSVISSVHSSIVNRLSHPSATETPLDAIRYLEKVQLLQYFDFAGLTESVEEVSALLFHTSVSTAVQETILYLEGIGIAIENSQRRSGMVQANALLSSVLRTLVHLSRTYPCLLILLDVGPGKDSKGDDAIQSAFSSPAGSEVKYQPAGALGRTLIGALDVMVVVHDVHGTVTDGSIVEVVKDRIGSTLGQWALWNSRQSKKVLEIGEYLQPAVPK